jgi:hypothetical protein
MPPTPAGSAAAFRGDGHWDQSASMNFLAHYALVRPDGPMPLTVLGNALPDLLPLASPRARFRLTALATAPDGPLKVGVRTHLIADAAFHKSPAFALARQEIKALLAGADFVGIRLRPFFLAHVLAELCLDAVLLRADPSLADSFYAACLAVDPQHVRHWAESAIQTPLPALPGVLARFTRSRYLDHYAADEGVAEGLTRLCARARQDTFRGGNFALLTTLVARAVSMIGPLTPKMLLETRQALH